MRAEKLRRAEVRARFEAVNANHLLALFRRKHSRFVQDTKEQRQQVSWLKRELAKTDKRAARCAERSESL